MFGQVSTSTLDRVLLTVLKVSEHKERFFCMKKHNKNLNDKFPFWIEVEVGLHRHLQQQEQHRC